MNVTESKKTWRMSPIHKATRLMCRIHQCPHRRSFEDIRRAANGSRSRIREVLQCNLARSDGPCESQTRIYRKYVIRMNEALSHPSCQAVRLWAPGMTDTL